MSSYKRLWLEGWRSANRVSVFVAGHLFRSLIFILATEIVQWFLTRLHDPKLLDLVPLRYVFDVMDIAVLCVFVVSAVRGAINAFRE